MQQKRSCELRANEYEMKSTLAAVGGELSGLQPLTTPHSTATSWPQAMPGVVNNNLCALMKIGREEARFGSF